MIPGATQRDRANSPVGTKSKVHNAPRCSVFTGFVVHLASQWESCLFCLLNTMAGRAVLEAGSRCHSVYLLFWKRMFKLCVQRIFVSIKYLPHISLMPCSCNKHLRRIPTFPTVWIISCFSPTKKFSSNTENTQPGDRSTTRQRNTINSHHNNRTRNASQR